LYNLRTNPGETTNVADKFPEIVAQIRQLAEEEKSALGEYNSKGPEVRKTIFVKTPELLIKTK
jgi:arylsulfatase